MHTLFCYYYFVQSAFCYTLYIQVCTLYKSELKMREELSKHVFKNSRLFSYIQFIYCVCHEQKTFFPRTRHIRTIKLKGLKIL